MSGVRLNLPGAGGLRLAATRHGAGGRPVLLLHGGGQTRHSFDKTAARLAREGYLAVTLDQRGHGDSERAPDGAYSFREFAADAAAAAAALAGISGARPVTVGASLGGNAALLACAPGAAPPFAGLVLVDVTPRMEPAGVAAVHGFMKRHAKEGFATVEEAADAIAGYLPHRPRPRSLAGLAKNLRQGAGGRYFWHWDPAFMEGARPIDTDRSIIEDELERAARALDIPVLLVRGRSSELVSEARAQEFLAMVPHAAYADIRGARHMVAGDENDAFSAAILGFLAAHFPPAENRESDQGPAVAP